MLLVLRSLGRGNGRVPLSRFGNRPLPALGKAVALPEGVANNPGLKLEPRAFPASPLDRLGRNPVPLTDEAGLGSGLVPLGLVNSESKFPCSPLSLTAGFGGEALADEVALLARIGAEGLTSRRPWIKEAMMVSRLALCLGSYCQAPQMTLRKMGWVSSGRLG